MNPIILADNCYLDGTPTATDTAAGYDVLNIRDLASYSSWKAASAGTKYLAVDRGSAKSANTLAIFKHNFGTAAAQISVESSSTGAWAGEQVERLAPFTPADDKAILKTFTPASARYWRKKIVTASIAPQLAETMIGTRIDFPYPPVTPYRPISEKPEAESARSKQGQLLGTVVRYVGYTIRPVWKNISRSWVDATFLPFWRDWGRLMTPFFWAWDLDTYPSDVRFVKFPDGFVYEPSVSRLSTYDELALEFEGVCE